MAYNLQSLITILEQILNPQQRRWILDHNKPHLEIEALLKKAVYLQQALDKSPLSKTESLESQIRDATHKAEDIIESYMVGEMLLWPRDVSFIFSSPDLQQVIKELDFAMDQVMKLKKMSSGSSSSGASSSSSKNASVVVGVDADLMQLKDRLAGMERKLEIIPIVGMGGIGKTTLARSLYQDPLIVEHFEFLAWTTISQDYNIKAVLLSLLRCIIGKDSDNYIQKETDKLKDILYKSLYGTRYMIVLDDIWSTQVWDEIWKYFPDNDNGSRIVITTREPDVAKYANSRSDLHHQVHLLNESDSWNLLREIVFGEEDCSDIHALQEIGRKISSDCGGLPLAISVIGGLLFRLERSKDAWENIGNDVRAAIVESDKQFSNILSLSYNNLPNHLRPCFLYMGAFPEDYEIKASRLIRMWVAEGFVKSNGDKSLEVKAEDYLKALVERNLLSVRHFSFNGTPKKRYIMHDLLRDLCVRKSDEEKFLHVVDNGPMDMFSTPARRLRVDTSYGMDNVYASAYQFMSLARSFIRTNHVDRHWEVNLPPSFFRLRLLRVLDIKEMKLRDFPREIFKLINLRYLAVSCLSSMPSGISRLCNLQTLIIYTSWSPGDLAHEIWEMSELRHFKSNYLISIRDGFIIEQVQEKLQAISSVNLTPSLIRSGFFASIPNIKKLDIYCEKLVSNTAVDLSHLHRLETLTCKSCTYEEDGSYFLNKLTFPPNLRKLELIGCMLFPRVFTALSALPRLEVLNISLCDVVHERLHETLEAREGDVFRSLQFLRLSHLSLWRFIADETNFPTLRHLLLYDCLQIHDIPSGFGEIPTLKLIELERCSYSAVASAKMIQKVQQTEFENYDIELRIR